MQIPTNHYSHIRSIDVNAAKTVVSWKHWEETMADNAYLLPRLKKVKESLGSTFSRAEVVQFYKDSQATPEIKFLAAMIWGHESETVGNRDGRGPWKLSQTFSDTSSAEAAIRGCAVWNDGDVLASYAKLKKSLKRCGPNFFTKHFYFLGKAIGRKDFPLIFDNRVAQGLAHIASNDPSLLQMISTAPITRPESYLSYLSFAHRQTAAIGCQPDQIEIFLFNLKQ